MCESRNNIMESYSQAHRRRVKLKTYSHTRASSKGLFFGSRIQIQLHFSCIRLPLLLSWQFRIEHCHRSHYWKNYYRSKIVVKKLGGRRAKSAPKPKTNKAKSSKLKMAAGINLARCQKCHREFSLKGGQSRGKSQQESEAEKGGI